MNNNKGFIQLLVVLVLFIVILASGMFLMLQTKYFSKSKEIESAPSLVSEDMFDNRIDKENYVSQGRFHVEPEIAQSLAEGFSKFTFPGGGYSFEFPSQMEVSVTGSDYWKDKFFDVQLIYSEDGNGSTIRFMTGGHDGITCDTEEAEQKTFGGRVTIWDYCYQDDKLNYLIVTFPNKEFKDYFIAIEMLYIPYTNQEYYINNFETILSSLKEYPGKSPNF